MLTINYNPDVLSCLANLSNDEVFTPPKLVNEILDMLPQELFQNKDTTFLDPVTKSGVFLREIAKRLNDGLKEQIPDQQERIDHIFSKQVYGIAITELTALLARRSVYCTKKANGKYSVCTNFNTEEGNIKYERLQHTWHPSSGSGRKCIYCGASEEVYSRTDDLETYAYQFIHTDKPQNIFNMKFDVIIGNPPYQLSDGGHGRSAKPLYHHFVAQAKKLNPKYLSMIIPSRWYSGGKGLDNFRDEMLNDKRISKLVDFANSKDCFSAGVDIPGGICYFLWDKDFNGECEVVNILGTNQITSTRVLNEFPIFVRDSKAVPVIHKALSKGDIVLSEVVSSRKPFGLATNCKPLKTGDLNLFHNKGLGKYKSELLEKGFDLINKWKVITSKVVYEHAGQPDKTGRMRVVSKLEVLPPKTVCTESYIIIDSFESQTEAENLLSYIRTKPVRYLIAQMLCSQDLTKDRFSFVPYPSMSESWSDARVADYLELSKEEEKFIDSFIIEL